ncbi:hypothetical protein PRUPE_3G166600 [Prunus persica]|uniref:Uncharacterized protein n=1 Tax=Prunus persica TaxID=3760 RepID=A0A251Q1E0_PRUPE|nr:hypothetical protein PRUPE_3G166600 [Prunus persica]
METYVWKKAFGSVDHQWNFDCFATVKKFKFINIKYKKKKKKTVYPSYHDNDCVMHRSAPEQSFEWATYIVVSVRFNTGQPDILATSASDCSIALYDSRMGKPRRRSLHEGR